AGVRTDHPADVEMAEWPVLCVARRPVGAEEAGASFAGGVVGRVALFLERRDRVRCRLRRLERDRVADIGQLREPGVRERAGERAAVLGQRPVVEPADDDERGLTDLAEAARERL